LRQVEPEAEFVQHQQFEADQEFRRRDGILQMSDDEPERLIERPVRIALRQEP
jgi:hypothetical protein